MLVRRSPFRPNRRAVAVLLTVLGLLVVTSCGQQKDPTEFNSKIEAAFIGTCSGTSTDTDATDNTANEAKDTAADSDADTIGTKSECTCVYNKLVKGGFKQFKKINDQLIDNPDQTLPEPVLTYTQECQGKSTSSTTTKSGSTTTTTTAPGGSTTTTAPTDTTASN